MEIALISEKSLKIKGKNASLIVDPKDKQEANAALLLNETINSISLENFQVIINGPGDYEAGGIKISVIRGMSAVVYEIIVDSVSIALGMVSDLEKIQSKLKESNIVVAYCDSDADASFLNSIASNIVIVYGEKAAEIGKALAGENAKQASKYASTIDKMPAEVETIVLE